jgi:hypothetical protein
LLSTIGGLRFRLRSSSYGGRVANPPYALCFKNGTFMAV